MNYLNIYSIVCESTEADGTAEACVVVKGQAETRIPEGAGTFHALKAGETWSVRKSYAFDGSVEVGIYDDDASEDRKQIAKFTYEGSTPGTTGSFSNGENRFRVTFSVTDAPAAFTELYLNIAQVRCEASDELGKAELYAKVTSGDVTSRYPKEGYIKLGDGETLDANVSVPFHGEVSVELWDENVITKDTHLGTFTANALVAEARADLRQNAYFIVSYSVTEELPNGFQHASTL